MRKYTTLLLFGAFLAWGQGDPVPAPLPRPELPAPGPAVPMPEVVPAYEQIKTYLTLTDAQVRSLREVQATRHQAERAIYQQISERQTTLSQLLNSGSTDAARIGQLMVEINQLRRQLPLPGEPYRTQALNVLTAEQRQKLPALEQALRLNGAAWEASSLSLVDAPRPQPLPAGAIGFGVPGVEASPVHVLPLGNPR